MITYWICEILAWLLNLISWVFSVLLSWTWPPQVQSGVHWLFSPLKYFGWLIDLHFLGSIILSIGVFYGVWWTYQIIRFGVSAFRTKAPLENPEL